MRKLKQQTGPSRDQSSDYMATYQAINVTGQPHPTRRMRREPVIIDGTKLWPGQSYHFDELTPDVLDLLSEGRINVSRGEQGVSIESLRAEGFVIESFVEAQTLYTIDGAKNVKRERLRIAEPEEQEEADDSQPAGNSDAANGQDGDPGDGGNPDGTGDPDETDDSDAPETGANEAGAENDAAASESGDAEASGNAETTDPGDSDEVGDSKEGEGESPAPSETGEAAPPPSDEPAVPNSEPEATETDAPAETTERSGDFSAKDAVDYIKSASEEDLEGFLSDDEARTTVLAAWEARFSSE